ncbi:membrane protein [Actinomycetota bacterium]|nr:membrane protein [Actinomycetota bacterium]
MPSRPRRTSAWWPTVIDVGDALVGLVSTALGLGAAIWIVDGVSASNPGSVLLAAVVVGAGDLVLRAPLRVLARAGGAAGALVAGLGGQVLVAWFALYVAPGITGSTGWSVVPVLVIAAVVMALARWVLGANDSEYVVADVLRRARSRARRTAATDARRAARRAGGDVPVTDPGAADLGATDLGDVGPGAVEPGARPPGLLVVQLDGVGTSVLEEAIEAGLAPTMARWLRAGDHTIDRWWARVPCTTPASQAGLLHGDSSRIPAFRWWDRGLGRLVVTNHPDDAALVEQRISTGEGLLAHGGVAISTMFSGDAATSLLVMSRARRGIGPGTSFLRFFASPFVLTRAVSLSLGEMVKELYQARRQRVRGVEPRVSRGGWYVVLRGVTNVLLRDLNTSLIAEHLMRGAPTVFVDLVDYDEIAHHAGPTRPESLRALEGLDRVLSVLERVVAAAPRDYRIVVLSDHGQSLGSTFAQEEGRSLLDTVRALMADPDADAVHSGSGEDWGPLNALLTGAVRGSREDAVALGPELAGRERRGPGVPGEAGTGAEATRDVPDVAVVASGNLALVWFPHSPRRLVLEEIQLRWPGLVAGLAARPAVGVVVVDTAAQGLVAVGARGLVHLERDAPAEGEDPLAVYGSRARADLARAGRLEHTGDLLLVSTATPGGHVHAFEGQVGSHGGLGGEQNVALLLHPSGWSLDADLLADVDGRTMLVGAEQVHVQLRRWSAALGLREEEAR